MITFRVVVFSMWSLIAITVDAAEPISVEVYMKRERGRFHLSAFIKNNGKTPVSVATSRLKLHFDTRANDEAAKRVFSGSTERDRWYASTMPRATVSIVDQERHNGDLIIPPRVDFRIVELRKGEKARIDSVVLAPLVKRLDSYTLNDLHPKSKCTFTMRYEVSQYWGERLGIWSGTSVSTVEIPKSLTP